MTMPSGRTNDIAQEVEGIKGEISSLLNQAFFGVKNEKSIWEPQDVEEFKNCLAVKCRKQQLFSMVSAGVLGYLFPITAIGTVTSKHARALSSGLCTIISMYFVTSVCFTQCYNVTKKKKFQALKGISENAVSDTQMDTNQKGHDLNIYQIIDEPTVVSNPSIFEDSTSIGLNSVDMRATEAAPETNFISYDELRRKNSNENDSDRNQSYFGSESSERKVRRNKYGDLLE